MVVMSSVTADFVSGAVKVVQNRPAGSNVLPYDSNAGKASRVHFEVERDARGRLMAKRRVANSGATLHELAGRSKAGGSSAR